MKQYSRTASKQFLSDEILGRVKKAGRSLASTKKKAAKKAAAKSVGQVKLPRRMDIESIVDIHKFIHGPCVSANWAELEKTINLIVVDVDTTLREKSRQWAKETAAEMRAVAPVDSGNLRDSIAILTKNANSAINASANIVDRRGPINVRVGIDEARLLPPPSYKDSTKRFTSGKYGPVRPIKVRIPPYNYAPFADDIIKAYHSEGYPGYDFLEKWQEIALNNLERIFK